MRVCILVVIASLLPSNRVLRPMHVELLHPCMPSSFEARLKKICAFSGQLSMLSPISTNRGVNMEMRNQIRRKWM